MSNFQYLVLGGVIGFFIGYVTNWMRTFESHLLAIKEEVDEVDVIVKKKLGNEPVDDTPAISNPDKNPTFWQRVKSRNAALLIVVLLVAYSSIVSQISANRSRDQSNDLAASNAALRATQDQLKRVVTCNAHVLDLTVAALNERTTYSSAQAAANVKLQADQAAFLEILIGPPPPSQAISLRAVDNYLHSLKVYQNISKKSVIKVDRNPYPPKHALSSCVARFKNSKEKK